VRESLLCSGELPLLRSSTRVYPVSGLLQKIIPNVPLTRPILGETRYFAIHGHKNVIVGGTTLQEALCGGRFCDRQRGPGSVGPCGCLHSEKGPKMIMQHTLQFSCDTNYSPSGSVQISGFRSFRFDKLVLQGLDYKVLNDIEPGNKPCNQVLREQVKKLVDHVNSSGGWTIIGWIRATHHPSPEEREEGDVLPHVVFVAPTIASDCDKMNRAYEAISMSRSEFWSRIEEKWPPEQMGNKRRKVGGNNPSSNTHK